MLNLNMKIANITYYINLVFLTAIKFKYKDVKKIHVFKNLKTGFLSV